MHPVKPSQQKPAGRFDPATDAFAREQSAILNGMCQLNEQQRALSGSGKSRRLRVATFNTGLLSAPWVRVPGVRHRGSLLPRTLGELDAEIILLQETWNIRYKRALEKALPQYLVLFSPKSHRGLVTLIKRTIIAEDTPAPSMQELIFARQRTIERLIYHKSALLVDFRLAGLETRLLVANVHLAAGNAIDIRVAQVQELWERMLRPRVQAHRDHLILGGDLNAAAYYAQDEYQIEGRRTRGWQKNSKVYNLLVSRTHAIDSFAAIHGDHEVHAVRNPDGVEIPWATQDRNNGLLRITRTARSEPSQRLDFVFVRPLGKTNRAVVEDSSIALTDKLVPFRGARVEQSDHYSYLTTLTLHS